MKDWKVGDKVTYQVREDTRKGIVVGLPSPEAIQAGNSDIIYIERLIGDDGHGSFDVKLDVMNRFDLHSDIG